MGGAAGGLFAFFDGTGQVIFSLLIGSRHAQLRSLRTHRVMIAGMLWGLVVGLVPTLFNMASAALALGCGAGAGALMAVILLGYISWIEDQENEQATQAEREQRAKREHREKIERTKRILELKKREQDRIAKAKKQEIYLDASDEIRRAGFVAKGVDPDDPEMVAEATAAEVSTHSTGCAVFVLATSATGIVILKLMFSA